MVGVQDRKERSSMASEANNDDTPVPAVMVAAEKAGTLTTVDKKTNKVMKRVSPEQVNFVLAAKPMMRTNRLPGPEELQQQGRQISEERRRQSAWVDEIFRSNNDILRSIQDDYHHQLATKGYVEVQVEISDDDAFVNNVSN